MESATNYLNNKRIKGAFNTWKFKAEKQKCESKLKDHFILKRCFGKWLKIKNKRRIISDLVNKKKNALEEKFVKASKNIDNILLYKTKQYFIGRLIKNVYNQIVCDILDNSYIKNYKRMFIYKLSLKPRLIKGFTKLDKTLNDNIKKDAIKKIKKKLKVNSFGEKLINTLIRKLKEKFISKIEFNKDYDDNNLDKEQIKIIKSGKKLKRIISKNLKKYAFNKLKNPFRMYKNVDKLNKYTEKICKKKFLENLKNRIDKINALNNIQKIIDKNKQDIFINKMKNISNSPEGKKNQNIIRCINLKNILKKIILNKVQKDAFHEIKNDYNIIIGGNNLSKLMNTKYKKRLFYLIQLLCLYNKPKAKKKHSRYPSSYMTELTELSTKIEKLMLNKIKKKFINKLKIIKNIKKIDERLNHMFLTLNNNVKKEIFDIFKAMHFVNKLNQIVNNIRDKRKQLIKKEFLDKLKKESDNIKKIENNNFLRNALNNWNSLTNKNKILNSLKNHLKLKKYYDLWKTKIDLNEIKNILIDMKKLRDKNNKELLEKHFNKWKEHTNKMNILSKIKDSKKEEIKKKILPKLKNILKSIDKNFLSKYYNRWKTNSKLLKLKMISDNAENPKPKLIPQTIYNTEYKPKKPKKPEFLIMKQNVISINDNKNTKDKEKDVKKDKSIKKRIVKRNKAKSKPKQNKFVKNFDILKKTFERWKKIAQEVKIKEDFKYIINKIKDYNDKKERKDNNPPISDENILQKLKKATVYLLLDLYKKNCDLLLKKYFNKWKKNIYEKNKEEKEEEPQNKYIKKKLGADNGLKEINKDTNNPQIIKSRNDKVFTKKKTKLNLYKEKIDLYNSLSLKSIYNNDQPDYQISNTEYSNNPINNNYNPYITTQNILSENPEKEYLRSIKKRNLELKIMSMTEYDDPQDDKEKDDEDIIGEYPKESMENWDEYERKKEIEDKININNGINLDKSLSSIDYSTKNHITLIEESNEVRKPINLTDKKPYEKKYPEKNKKIKNLLSFPFESINRSNNLHHNNKTTDKKSRNRNQKKYDDINSSDLYNNTSQSQLKYNHKRDNLKTFTVSIPVNNNYDDGSDGDNGIYGLKYSELKTDKITPLKKYNNKYLNENINTQYKNRNINTPFRDYSINWEKGNFTCPRIINNDFDKNNYLNEYSLAENKGYKGKNNKLSRHNKCKSGLDYTKENKEYFHNKDTDNNINTKYDFNRKKLFI